MLKMKDLYKNPILKKVFCYYFLIFIKYFLKKALEKVLDDE